MAAASDKEPLLEAVEENTVDETDKSAANAVTEGTHSYQPETTPRTSDTEPLLEVIDEASNAANAAANVGTNDAANVADNAAANHPSAEPNQAEIPNTQDVRAAEDQPVTPSRKKSSAGRARSSRGPCDIRRLSYLVGRTPEVSPTRATVPPATDGPFYSKFAKFWCAILGAFLLAYGGFCFASGRVCTDFSPDQNSISLIFTVTGTILVLKSVLLFRPIYLDILQPRVHRYLMINYHASLYLIDVFVSLAMLSMIILGVVWLYLNQKLYADSIFYTSNSTSSPTNLTVEFSSNNETLVDTFSNESKSGCRYMLLLASFLNIQGFLIFFASAIVGFTAVGMILLSPCCADYLPDEMP